MEQQRKEPTLAEQLSQIRKDIKFLAKTLSLRGDHNRIISVFWRFRTSPDEVLRLLSHREIVILNAEIRRIHEHLDLIEGRATKAKGEK